MKIAFNPSTVAALTSPPKNKDITFDLRGRNIFARGVEFKGTDTNTWRDIKINNVSIGSNTLDLRNGGNTTLTNTNGVVTINSTWRPVVDSLTSDSTTSSLSANQGRVLAGLINGKSDSDHNHDGRYLKLTGGTLTGNLVGTSAMFSGRFYGNGDDEGIIIKPSSNGYAGLILGTHDGERSIFYFVKNKPFWRYSHGSDNLDIIHPKKSGTIALTSDIPNKNSWNYDDRYLKLTGGTMLLGEGLKFHSDGNYFGTYEDARIISLLDDNDMICDGGLIIDERATLDGKEYVTELLRIRDSEFKWRGADILHSGNYSSILDSRYYTESEVNSLLSKKLDRVNLSVGSWNPRGYNLAADYFYNGGDLSISESGGQIHVSVDGYFWQNEGRYRVLDTSDVAGLKDNLTVHQYLSNTDTTWWPLIWGGSSHNNTSDSTGAVYKSHDVLSWQTSSQTLYATNLYTGQLKTVGNHYYQFNSDATLRIYGSSRDTASERVYFQAGIDNRIDDYDIPSYGGDQRHSIILNPRGGFVGIGDSNPTCRLSVGGDAKITGSIRDLAIGGGIYWNPYVESTDDGSDAASITLVKSGVAGGTTLVLSQMNDANDTIQFQTNGSARLYHNSYPILTTQNTYTSNGKGYINGTEITQVNNADTLDGEHGYGYVRTRVNLQSTPNNIAKYVGGYIGMIINDNDGSYPEGKNSGWHHIISMNYNNSPEGSGSDGNYWCSQLINQAGSNKLYIRSRAGGNDITTNWTSWEQLATTAGNIASATKLQTARRIWGQSFDGTADVDNTLRIRHTTGNYCEGIRIQTSDGAWSTIILGATADSGTNTNAWSIHRKSDNNFAISRNSSDGANGLVMTPTGMGLGTTAPTQRLDVAGNIRTTGNLYISHATNNNMNHDTSNPRIVFSESGSQAVGLVYTDYNSYRASKGLKVMDVDNNDPGNVWFEVQGYNYSSGYVKNGSNDNYVLLGGGGHKAESSLRVAYASNAGNAETLGGFPKNYGQAPFGTIPCIGNNGVMEIGRYIDYHYDNSGSYDFSTRLQASGNNKNVVTLPSASGTLALTSDILNYYWANVKISTSSSTTTSPTVDSLTALSYIKIGNIYLEHASEINCASGLYLNFKNSANVNLCNRGGNVFLCHGKGQVGIGTISPAYKLDVKGDIYSSGQVKASSVSLKTIAGTYYKQPVCLACGYVYDGPNGSGYRNQAISCNIRAEISMLDSNGKYVVWFPEIIDSNYDRQQMSLQLTGCAHGQSTDGTVKAVGTLIHRGTNLAINVWTSDDDSINPSSFYFAIWSWQ